MRLLMIAAPGGGKGTQGERLAAKFSVQHVSSGEVLLAEARAGTPVGRELAAYQERHAHPPRGSLPAAVALGSPWSTSSGIIGGALAGIPTVLFAPGHWLTAGIVAAAGLIGSSQLAEDHGAELPCS